MNIEVEGFTRGQIEAALFSSARKVRYEFTLQNSKGNHLGYIEVNNATISFSSSAKVMRTFKGKVKKSDFVNANCLDYRIIPWMVLEISKGREAKWPLGVFLCSFSEEMQDYATYIDITGYDLAKIALDDKIATREYIAKTAKYTDAIKTLISSLYSSYEIAELATVMAGAQAWENGTSKIDIINELLSAINYHPLFFDENGKAIAEKWEYTDSTPVSFSYIANQISVVIDGITVQSNKFAIPNKWVRYVENPDMPYLISTYTNSDPKSPYSTVSRNRTIVDTQAIDNISNQTTLDDYVKRIASESMQATEQVEFSTLNIPGHGYKEILFLDIPAYGIQGKYIETAWEMELAPGGTMRHFVERMVVL